MKLYAPSTIRDIKARYGFQLTKSLGQNFLIDKNIIDEIVEGSGAGPDDLVLEIGPGIGVITYEAAQVAGKVVTIEIDKNLIPILEETLGGCDNVEVVNSDILKTDVNAIIEAQRQAGTFSGGVRIIGNLPYYITTPIIMKLLEEGVEAETITIMMQKEVADRIKAKPSTKPYGAVSVLVQYYCTVDDLADVPRNVFVPPPNVDSAVLRLNIRKEKTVELRNDETFFQTVKASFNQRRKTLSNSLMGVTGVTKEIVKDALEAAGIEATRRGETLDLEEFARLANEIDARL